MNVIYIYNIKFASTVCTTRFWFKFFGIGQCSWPCKHRQMYCYKGHIHKN